MSKLSTPTGLTPAQLQVAAALASGASISKAAKSCQVGRTTIHSWLNTVPRFAQTVQDSSIDAAQQLHDQLHDCAMDAINTISALINDSTVSPSVRLRAALAVLNRPTFPDKGWALPYPIGTQAEIRQQEINNQLGADLKAMKIESQIREHIVAEAEAEAAAATPHNGTLPNTSEQQTPDFIPVPAAAPSSSTIADPDAYRRPIAEPLLPFLTATSTKTGTLRNSSEQNFTISNPPVNPNARAAAA